jgi:hypothetical protein
MLVNLRALLGVVIDIIRFKGGPENLPTSTALLACVVALFAAVTGFAGAWVPIPKQPPWPAELLCGIVVTLAWFHVALRNAKKPERFVQTMTALFAVRTLFMPVLLPMAATLRTALAANQSPPVPLALAMVVLSIWLFVTEVRIIRAAFEWPTVGAVGMVLAQEFSAALILGILLGLTTTPG